MRCVGVSFCLFIALACASAVPVPAPTYRDNFENLVEVGAWLDRYHADMDSWMASGSGSVDDDDDHIDDFDDLTPASNWVDNWDYDSVDDDAPETVWDIEMIWNPFSE